MIAMMPKTLSYYRKWKVRPQIEYAKDKDEK